MLCERLVLTESSCNGYEFLPNNPVMLPMTKEEDLTTKQMSSYWWVRGSFSLEGFKEQFMIQSRAFLNLKVKDCSMPPRSDEPWASDSLTKVASGRLKITTGL